MTGQLMGDGLEGGSWEDIGCQVTEDGSLDGGDGRRVSYLSAPVTYLVVGVRGWERAIWEYK